MCFYSDFTGRMRLKIPWPIKHGDVFKLTLNIIIIKIRPLKALMLFHRIVDSVCDDFDFLSERLFQIMILIIFLNKYVLIIALKK